MFLNVEKSVAGLSLMLESIQHCKNFVLWDIAKCWEILCCGCDFDVARNLMLRKFHVVSFFIVEESQCCGLNFYVERDPVLRDFRVVRYYWMMPKFNFVGLILMLQDTKCCGIYLWDIEWWKNFLSRVDFWCCEISSVAIV